MSKQDDLIGIINDLKTLASPAGEVFTDSERINQFIELTNKIKQLNMNNHECEWITIQEVTGDSGILGIFTNLAFGGFTHYIVQKCKVCGVIRKINI